MTPEELQAARDRVVPDVVAGGLRVLFCGINPSLTTAATGHHFAHPGNRFWPVLHRSGFTPRQLKASEQEQLLGFGLGITNVVARATARADELGPEEFREGGRVLSAKVEELRPLWLAVVGVTAYRTAFGDRRARIGPQERTVGGSRVWALPNPSGLNAHWTVQTMADEYARLLAAAGRNSSGWLPAHRRLLEPPPDLLGAHSGSAARSLCGPGDQSGPGDQQAE